MPVQSLKPCCCSAETPSTLSLYAAAWKAAAQFAMNEVSEYGRLGETSKPLTLAPCEFSEGLA